MIYKKSIISLALSFFFLLSSSSVDAASVPDMQSQLASVDREIAQIDARIAELEVQLTASINETNAILGNADSSRLEAMAQKAKILSTEVDTSCQKAGSILSETSAKLNVIDTALARLENTVAKYDGVGATSSQMLSTVNAAHVRVEALTVELGGISTESSALAKEMSSQVKVLKDVNTNAQRDAVCSTIFARGARGKQLYQRSKNLYAQLKGEKAKAENMVQQLVETKAGIDTIANVESLINDVRTCDPQIAIVGGELDSARHSIEALGDLKKEAKSLYSELKSILKPIRKTAEGESALAHIRALLQQIELAYSSVKKRPNANEKELKKIAKKYRSMRRDLN